MKHGKKRKLHTKMDDKVSLGPSKDKPASHRSWTVHTIIFIFFCGLVLTIWIAINRQENTPLSTRPGRPGETGAAMQANPTPHNSTYLPPAPEIQSKPVNRFDPLTGKPITSSSPTTKYKGYIIAFCCPQSESYNGGWDRMSDSEKDAFVLRSLNQKSVQ